MGEIAFPDENTGASFLCHRSGADFRDGLRASGAEIHAGSFHIPVSYGRLREACQTDVDGTSIDTLEEIARSLGLDAEQVMLPPDHLWLPAAAALPAIIVVRLPSGLTHFVVAWQRHGGWVQLMDPASGRRWQTQEHFLHELFIHRMKVPAADWQEWACSGDFVIPLTCRLHDLGLRELAQSLVADAVAAPGWKALAVLDAATRLTATLVRGKGLRAGREAAAVLEDILRRAAASPDDALRYPGKLLVGAPGIA